MRIELKAQADIYFDYFETISDEDIEIHVKSILSKLEVKLYESAYKDQAKQEKSIERLIQFCNTGRIEK